MRKVLYTTAEERTAALKAAEAQGKECIHDNDVMGPTGEDGIVGPTGEHELLFDTPAPDVPSPGELELAALRNDLKLDNMTLAKVIRYLQLREGM